MQAELCAARNRFDFMEQLLIPHCEFEEVRFVVALAGEALGRQFAFVSLEEDSLVAEFYERAVAESGTVLEVLGDRTANQTTAAQEAANQDDTDAADESLLRIYFWFPFHGMGFQNLTRVKDANGRLVSRTTIHVAIPSDTKYSPGPGGCWDVPWFRRENVTLTREDPPSVVTTEMKKECPNRSVRKRNAVWRSANHIEPPLNSTTLLGYFLFISPKDNRETRPGMIVERIRLVVMNVMDK